MSDQKPVRRAIPKVHPDIPSSDRQRVFDLALRGMFVEAFELVSELEQRRLEATSLRGTDTASIVAERKIIKALLNSNDPTRRARGRQRAAELSRNRRQLIEQDRLQAAAQRRRERAEDAEAEAVRVRHRERARKGVEARRRRLAADAPLTLFLIPGIPDDEAA